MKVNLEGRSGNLKFEGTFPTIIDSIEIKKSSNGNDMITATFKVTGRDFNGFKIRENFVLSNEIALERLTNLVDAVGLDRNFEVKDLNRKMVNSIVKKKKNEDYSSIQEWTKYEAPSEAV